MPDLYITSRELSSDAKRKEFIREYVLARAGHKEYFDGLVAAQTASDIYDKFLK